MRDAAEDPPPSATPERSTSLTLLQRLRGNEPDAWERVVRLYGPLVRYWCGRMGVSRDDVEDVVQDVFQVISTGLAGFRREHPGERFRAWLRGVTRHKVYHFRRADRGPHASGGTDAFVRLQAVPEAPPVAPEEDDPPAELNALYRRALELVRGEFEERTWRAFWLNVLEGRSPADVAADMGVTAAAVRKAKSRVLRRLKEELGDLIE